MRFTLNDEEEDNDSDVKKYDFSPPIEALEYFTYVD